MVQVIFFQDMATRMLPMKKDFAYYVNDVYIHRITQSSCWENRKQLYYHVMSHQIALFKAWKYLEKHHFVSDPCNVRRLCERTLSHLQTVEIVRREGDNIPVPPIFNSEGVQGFRVKFMQDLLPVFRGAITSEWQDHAESLLLSFCDMICDIWQDLRDPNDTMYWKEVAVIGQEIAQYAEKQKEKPVRPGKFAFRT